MHNIDLYGLKCTREGTLSLSCISLFISPFGYISGHVKSYVCLQCAVCQGSGSNWLTSCCYFTCLSLFFHTFPKPWHDSRATAAFAGKKIRKKDSFFAWKSNFFFLFLSGWREMHKVIKCLCLFVCRSEKVSSSWEKYGNQFFLLSPLPNYLSTLILCFIAHICTYFTVSFDFPCFIACSLSKHNCIWTPWGSAFALLNNEYILLSKVIAFISCCVCILGLYSLT